MNNDSLPSSRYAMVGLIVRAFMDTIMFMSMSAMNRMRVAIPPSVIPVYLAMSAPRKLISMAMPNLMNVLLCMVVLL